jgi:hypothetical protein
MQEREDDSRELRHSDARTDVARQIRTAMLAARRAPAIVEELRALTESDFDKLAQAPTCDEIASRAIEQVPRISGYALEEEISRGGQGAVYRAKQESTGKQVAVNVSM